MRFFPRDTPPTKGILAYSNPQLLSLFKEKGFHFGAGYDCHGCVIKTSSGLRAGMMNDKNVPEGDDTGETIL